MAVDKEKQIQFCVSNVRLARKDLLLLGQQATVLIPVRALGVASRPIEAAARFRSNQLRSKRSC